MGGLRRRALAIAALLAILVTLALPGVAGWQAQAHAQLVASSPGAGELLADSPDELILVFSEPLEASFSAVDVTSAGGELILARAGEVDPSDQFQLIVTLPPLGDGVYTVTWSSLSAADGHTAGGFFSFGVGETAEPIPAGGLTHASVDEGSAVTAVGRGLAYAGLIAGFGVPIIARVVLRQRPGRRAIGLVGALLIVSAVATVALAIRAGLALEGDQPGEYLFGSRNGPLEVARAAVIGTGGAVVLVLARRRPGMALPVAWLAAAIGIGLLVVAGHAAALPGFAPLAVQAIHVAAVSVWLSGVACLLVVALRRPPPDDPLHLTALVPRFSALALVSIGLAGMTGAFAAWGHLAALPDPATEYGRNLIIKLGLAAGALALGGLNYLDGGRSLRWLGGLRWRLSVEVSLAAAVLLATGLLATAPPAETAHGVGIAPVPNAFGEVAPGMSLELAPGRPGVNHVAVDLTGALDDVSVELVLDRLDGTGGQTRLPLRPMGEGHDADAMPGMGHGGGAAESSDAAEEDDRDRRVADAVVLPAGSEWDASVLILAGHEGRELNRQRYAFTMGDDGVASGGVEGVLEPGLLIGLALLGGGALSVGLGIGGTRLPRCEAAASRIALSGGGAVAVALGVLIGLGRLA
jgi:copper transport protein